MAKTTNTHMDLVTYRLNQPRGRFSEKDGEYKIIKKRGGRRQYMIIYISKINLIKYRYSE